MNQSVNESRQKILIIDDEPLMHLSYRQHIEKAGFTQEFKTKLADFT